MTNLPLCPFIAGPKITDPRFFVGRKDELRALTNRMSGVQPISVNVVGDRRIGKSSLLYHFYQTWEQRVANPSNFAVIYLSLQEVNPHSDGIFYKAILHGFNQRPAIQQHRHLATALGQVSITRSEFAQAIKELSSLHILPVICLDEFEMLLKHPQQFDDFFFDHLRGLMDDNALMFTISSLKPLDEYLKKHKLTSSFFNLGHVITLGLLTDEAQNELVLLPASTIPQTSPALGMGEQRLAKEWGKNHPYLLQLAALILCEAQQGGHDVSWAKSRFDREEGRVPRNRWRWVKKLPRQIFWSFPQWVGSIPLRLGNKVDTTFNWIIGMVIIVGVIGVLAQWFGLIEFLQYLLRWFGVGGE